MSELMVAQVAEQKQKETLIPSLYNKEDAGLSQRKLQFRVTQLWEALCEQDTAQTYQKAGTRTWIILERAFRLAGFLVTSFVAIVLWLCGIGFRSGFQFRHWIETEKPSTSEIVGLVLKVLMLPLVAAVRWADGFVKQYFGWELSVEPAQDDAPVPDDVSETEETPVPLV